MIFFAGGGGFWYLNPQKRRIRSTNNVTTVETEKDISLNFFSSDIIIRLWQQLQKLNDIVEFQQVLHLVDLKHPKELPQFEQEQ